MWPDTGDAPADDTGDTPEDDGSVRAAVSCSSGEWSVAVEGLASFVDGSVHLEVLLNGVSLLPEVIVITKDTVVPTFTEDSSFDGITLTLADPTASLQGTCNEDGSVSISLGGDHEPVTADCAVDGGWSASIDFAGTVHGSHNVEISFQDSAGNPAADMITGVVNRDTEAPTIAIDDPSSNPIFSGNEGAYILTGDCEDGSTLRNFR